MWVTCPPSYMFETNKLDGWLIVAFHETVNRRGKMVIGALHVIWFPSSPSLAAIAFRAGSPGNIEIKVIINK